MLTRRHKPSAATYRATRVAEYGSFYRRRALQLCPSILGLLAHLPPVSPGIDGALVTENETVFKISH